MKPAKWPFHYLKGKREFLCGIWTNSGNRDWVYEKLYKGKFFGTHNWKKKIIYFLNFE